MKTTVPFTIRNVHQGLAEVEGILSIDGADLKLEFRTAETVLSVFKSGVREVRLPVGKIEEVRFRKGWFGCKLAMRLSEMKGASEIPNFRRGEIVLSIAKKHSQAAFDLVSAIQTPTSRTTH